MSGPVPLPASGRPAARRIGSRSSTFPLRSRPHSRRRSALRSADRLADHAPVENTAGVSKGSVTDSAWPRIWRCAVREGGMRPMDLATVKDVAVVGAILDLLQQRVGT